jgi:hypothetical protein
MHPEEQNYDSKKVQGEYTLYFYTRPLGFVTVEIYDRSDYQGSIDGKPSDIDTLIDRYLTVCDEYKHTDF